MKNGFSVDRESFQTFLANAFAVQESGLNPETLAAFIEIQRFIASDEFDLDKAIHMIADCALGVSNAAGVAIAQLVDDELVYRAGIGSAVQDVGRRIPAVLAASLPEGSRLEILRVENAAANSRIEAEICRQFGAMSLIMLPIHHTDGHHHGLAGVLQVLFSEAHSFAEREVRAYRLLITALEEGILRLERTYESQGPGLPMQVQPKLSDLPQEFQIAENAVPGLVAVRAAEGHDNAQRQVLALNVRRSAESAIRACRNVKARAKGQVSVLGNWLTSAARIRANRLSAVPFDNAVERAASAWRNVGARVSGEVSALRNWLQRATRKNVPRLPAANLDASLKNAMGAWRNAGTRVGGGVGTLRNWLTSAARQNVSWLWYKGLRASEGALIAVVVLITAVWVFNHDRSANRGSAGLTSVATQSQPAAKPLTVDQEPKLVTHEPQQNAVPKQGFKRVRVGPNEVDYVTDDVTIRNFETRHPKREARKNVKEKTFGDDVTVRYFADAPQLDSPSGTSISRPASVKQSLQSR
jgi:hypothetical protein